VKPVALYGHNWVTLTWLYKSFECCFTFAASGSIVFTVASILLAQTSHTALEDPVKIGIRSRGSAMQKIEHAMPQVDKQNTIAAVKHGRLCKLSLVGEEASMRTLDKGWGEGRA
jgi:hypothetical protein